MNGTQIDRSGSMKSVFYRFPNAISPNIHQPYKGPLCDLNMLRLWYQLISKFSVNSEVAFVSYACFTVSHCCIGHYML